jgi:hypothetical protein
VQNLGAVLADTDPPWQQATPHSDRDVAVEAPVDLQQPEDTDMETAAPTDEEQQPPQTDDRGVWM